jgi:hypothetical protein
MPPTTLRKKTTRRSIAIFWPEGYTPEAMAFGGYKNIVTPSDLEKRVHELIIPLAHSFDCVHNVQILQSEKQLLNILSKRPECFPEFYHPKYYYPPPLDYRRVFRTLQNSDNFKLPVIKIPDDLEEEKIQKPYVTLTLRDYGFDPNRNTTQQNVDQFFRFSQKLQVKAVFVPDDIKKLSQYKFPDRSFVYSAAREEIKKRILLYSKSLVNLFPPGGCFSLPLFIPNTKNICFNLGINSLLVNPKNLKKQQLWPVGAQPCRKLNGFFLWHQEHPEPTAEDFLASFESLKCNI